LISGGQQWHQCAGGFVNDTKPFAAAKLPLVRFVDGLIEPLQQDRTALVLLGGYLLVWTLYGVIAKSSQDLHPDMTELIGWSRNLALGFPKHPPFAAMLVRGWFALFPLTDWAYYLLAMATATLALWVTWLVFTDYLEPSKRLVALALLTFVPFFNFHALKFNVNTVLMPLWAVTTFWFLHSYRFRSPGYAALAGVAGGLSMLCKYWSGFLLAGLAVAALSDFRRRDYFRSAAPWITIVVTVAVLSPHLGWLQKHQFSTFEYAMLVHGNKSFGEALESAFRYLTDSLAFVCVPIAIALLAARPNKDALLDMVWPPDGDRRLAAVAFWSVLLLPIVPALIWGVAINGLWSMSAWTLLPVVLLSPSALQIPRARVTWIIGSALALPLIMLAAAPAVAFFVHERGLPPQMNQVEMLARRVTDAWHAVTPKRLPYVGGDAGLAHSVVTYSRDRPQALVDVPLLSGPEARERGMALVCIAEESDCVVLAERVAKANPAARKIETELSRVYFGISGETHHYVIFVLPPEPSASQ
jgi:4-amino-4-deoxy-L-arabinose transferase-like glycosyltransferase